MTQTGPNTESTTDPTLVPKVKKLPVMEVFGPTIQGEGHLAGAQTAFIRFGLCDYKCTMCDSIHAIDPHFVQAHAMWMTPEEIVETLEKGRHASPPQWITLSGGNPAIHDLSDLVARLIERGYPIAIETQGTKAPDWISRLDCVTVSPKSPGMGEKFEPNKLDAFLRKCYHTPAWDNLNIKVVVFSAQDLEFAAMISSEFVEQYGLQDRFYLSLGNLQVPRIVDGELHPFASRDPLEPYDSVQHKMQLLREYGQLAEELCGDPRLRNARFMPQLHVLAWGNEPGR